MSRRYYDPIRGDDHIKDIACDLACVADDTGYEAEFLYEMFDEDVDDRLKTGETFIEARKNAFDYVVGVSYERDWLSGSCQHCSNHPSNGGSGICHCILGSRSNVRW